MYKSIVGFHKDEEGHWAAELECGHTQHVRHKPPFLIRSWVTTAEGRANQVGKKLFCKLCNENINGDSIVSKR